jgi:hypothetical protein
VLLKADLAAVRLEQVVEIDRNDEPALEASSAVTGASRQWLDLINSYDRHINATLDRQKED